LLHRAEAASASGDIAALKSALIGLKPAAVELASDAIPYCADPTRLYPELVVRFYAASAAARSASGTGRLQRAAARVPGLLKLEHQMITVAARSAGTRQ